MKVLFIAILMSFGFVSPSYADIQDRINSCERNNGGACLYDLLRELARNRGGRGRGVEVKFYDELNCSSEMGTAKIRPRKADAVCRSVINGISNFENIDSMKFGGTCINLSNDTSDQYTLDQLVTFCSQNI